MASPCALSVTCKCVLKFSSWVGKISCSPVKGAITVSLWWSANVGSGCVTKWWASRCENTPGVKSFIYDLRGGASEQDDFTLLQEIGIYRGKLEKILHIVHARRTQVDNISWCNYIIQMECYIIFLEYILIISIGQFAIEPNLDRKLHSWLK